MLKPIISVYILFLSNITFAASKSNEGMPQLDVTTYPSLIFWLIISFGFTFLMLKYYVTPKMSEILKHRKEKIDNDIFEAKKAREDAESTKMNQEQSILEAKEKAIKIVKDTIEKSKSKLSKEENQAKVKLANQLKVAEKNILEAKIKSLKTVNKIASEIVFLVSGKVSGIDIDKDLIIKSLDDEIKNSNSLIDLKVGTK